MEIYVLTAKGPIARDFGLRDQLRAAAVSIPSNIAEGDERGSNRDCVRFFHIAKGSVAELRTQLEIAREVSLLDQAIATGASAGEATIGPEIVREMIGSASCFGGGAIS